MNGGDFHNQDNAYLAVQMAAYPLFVRTDKKLAQGKVLTVDNF